MIFVCAQFVKQAFPPIMIHFILGEFTDLLTWVGFLALARPLFVVCCTQIGFNRIYQIVPLVHLKYLCYYQYLFTPATLAFSLTAVPLSSLSNYTPVSPGNILDVSTMRKNSVSHLLQLLLCFTGRMSETITLGQPEDPCTAPADEC